MILADTSVWIDHFRTGDADLARWLSTGSIACHPCVTAELALGPLKDRDTVLALLDRLPVLPLASVPEIRRLIEARRLMQRGIGFVDASLVASVLLAPGTQLWTRDRRLDVVANDLGIAVSGSS